MSINESSFCQSLGKYFNGFSDIRETDTKIKIIGACKILSYLAILTAGAALVYFQNLSYLPFVLPVAAGTACGIAFCERCARSVTKEELDAASDQLMEDIKKGGRDAFPQAFDLALKYHRIQDNVKADSHLLFAINRALPGQGEIWKCLFHLLKDEQNLNKQQISLLQEIKGNLNEGAKDTLPQRVKKCCQEVRNLERAFYKSESKAIQAGDQEAMARIKADRENMANQFINLAKGCAALNNAQVNEEYLSNQYEIAKVEATLNRENALKTINAAALRIPALEEPALQIKLKLKFASLLLSIDQSKLAKEFIENAKFLHKPPNSILNEERFMKIEAKLSIYESCEEARAILRSIEGNLVVLKTAMESAKNSRIDVLDVLECYLVTPEEKKLFKEAIVNARNAGCSEEASLKEYMEIDFIRIRELIKKAKEYDVAYKKRFENKDYEAHLSQIDEIEQKIVGLL